LAENIREINPAGNGCISQIAFSKLEKFSQIFFLTVGGYLDFFLHNHCLGKNHRSPK